MTGIAVFGIFVLLAGTVYLVGIHGSRLGIDLGSPMDEEARRRQDAQRGGRIFADIGNTLHGHKESLTHLLAVGREEPANEGASASCPTSRLARYVQGTLKQNAEVGQSLHTQLELLQALMSDYGNLYDNEQRNIASYCSLTDKLNAALRGLENGPGGERDQSTIALAHRMIRENDKLRSRVSGCEAQIEALMTDMSRLEKETRTDSLTQLPNRRAWEEKLAEPTSEPRVFVMIDLDRFKEINDIHGHYAGDGILNLVATMIRNTPEVVGYRIAGDEFAMMMSNRIWNRAGYILEQFRRRVEKASLNDGGDRIQVTVSVGATRSLPVESLQETSKRADEALYVAKAAGGNGVHLIDVTQPQATQPRPESQATPPNPEPRQLSGTDRYLDDSVSVSEPASLDESVGLAKSRVVAEA